jgi:predicted transcriptional regulator
MGKLLDYVTTFGKDLLTLTGKVKRSGEEILALRQDVKELADKVEKLSHRVVELSGDIKLLDERLSGKIDRADERARTAYRTMAELIDDRHKVINAEVELALERFKRRLPPMRGGREED